MNTAVSSETPWAYPSGLVVAVLLGVVSATPPSAEPYAPSRGLCPPINTATDVRCNIGMLPRETQNEYQPRTALGKKLIALRRAYIENGGTLLDDAAFKAELRSRRGGVNA